MPAAPSGPGALGVVHQGVTDDVDEAEDQLRSLIARFGLCWASGAHSARDSDLLLLDAGDDAPAAEILARFALVRAEIVLVPTIADLVGQLGVVVEFADVLTSNGTWYRRKPGIQRLTAHPG
ncbi:hypothetical protein ACWIGI_18510 [Nocardia sp. NPDC055321]